MAAPKHPRLALASWAIYDWGNSAFATVIQTFVFAAYFVKSVAPNEAIGSTWWGFVTGFSALVVGLLSPLLGAAADQGGRRKHWLAFFTALCVVPTALLWFIQPSPDFFWPALALVAVGAIGAEGAYIFYNAILPDVAAPNEVGRWSGWGWGLGYVGGMAALVLSLVVFVDTSNAWVSLNSALAEPVRATFLLAAAWYTLFCLPLFFFIPDTPSRNKSLRQSLTDGLGQLCKTFAQIRRYRAIAIFLVAKMLYVDGLATLFAFGGIYAATVFGMDEKEVLLFGITLNLSAGFGAITLACLDDKIGSKRMILFSLAALIALGSMAVVAVQPWQFWMLGLMLGIFVGPVQSSSRSLMAHLAPPHLRNQMFGFYMFSGKATAFLGPLLYGWAVFLSGNLRWGMATVILLFIAGGSLMFLVADGEAEEVKAKG